MADVEWTGVNEFGRWINRMSNPHAYDDLLEDIGKTAVTLTTKKLADNRVKPKTKNRTLRRRRTRKKKPSTSGITLVDNAVGIKQVSYRTYPASRSTQWTAAVEVGVPDGYMAYHQEGRVPRARRRKFLTLPGKRMLRMMTKFHWERLARNAR